MRAVEEKAGGPFRLCGFEQTSARICPSFYAYDGRALAHPVGHLRPMLRLERIERPIRIGHHVNPPFRGDEDGHVRGSVAGLGSAFSSIQNLHRVVYESAHNSLIEAANRRLNLFETLVPLRPPKNLHWIHAHPAF